MLFIFAFVWNQQFCEKYTSSNFLRFNCQVYQSAIFCFCLILDQYIHICFVTLINNNSLFIWDIMNDDSLALFTKTTNMHLIELFSLKSISQQFDLNIVISYLIEMFVRKEISWCFAFFIEKRNSCQVGMRNGPLPVEQRRGHHPS